MEMSKLEEQRYTSMKNEEDEMIQKAMQASKEEEKEREEMVKKNEQLMKLMKQIEDDKPENWGLKKINAEDPNQDFQEIYAQNMAKALKKLELQNKIDAIKKEQGKNQKPEANEQTEEEAKQEQKEKMGEFRDKLLAARNAQRENELMRSTFHSIKKEEEKVNDIIDQEIQKQKSELDEKAAKRKEKQELRATGMNFNVIKDNYDGNIDDKESTTDATKKDEDVERKKILDDDFLGDLKAVDVPDSDDECYF